MTRHRDATHKLRSIKVGSNSQLVKDFIQAWNDKELDRAADMLSEDVAYHNIPMEPINGREPARAFFKTMGDAKAIQWDLLNIAENGDTVMTERIDGFSFADGKEVAVPLMGIFKIENGKIKEWRDYFDLGDFQRQMAG